MTLPSYIKSNQSGQVLVIFLLVLVIGLALVLSIASRTVTDIRQTTTSDESNRAYFAAESGVEDALKKIAANEAIAGPYTLNFTSVNQTQANVSASPLLWTLGEPPLEFGTFAKDDVAQINLLNDFTDLSLGSNITAANTLNLYWGDKTKTYSGASVPAIEVSIVTYNSSGGTWGIKKMTFDPSTRNNFCFVPPTPEPKYKYKVALKLNDNTTPNCPRNDIVSDPPVIARVRFLYNAEDVLFAVSADKNLSKQGDLVTSTGFTPSGVSRKLEVKRFYPALPAIFDYVLYNGSTDPLCKGSC